MRDVPEPDAFILDRPREHYLQYGWNRHTCLGQHVSPVIIVESMIALLGLQDLARPERTGRRGGLSVRAPVRPAAARRSEPVRDHVLACVRRFAGRPAASGRWHPAAPLQVEVRCAARASTVDSLCLLLSRSSSDRVRARAAATKAGVRTRPRAPRRGSSRRSKDDSSEDIMSWVDGQVVTDWAAEIAKRDRAIDGYLNDADPDHAAKYGFRSGQNPQLAWNWFRDNPVGFNGVPFVLFKTILDLDPESREPDAAQDRADLEARGARCRSARVLRDQVDVRSHRRRAESRRLRRRRRAAGRGTPGAAAVRIRVREPADVRAAVDDRGDDARRATAREARVPEHEPADRQAAEPPTRRRTGRRIDRGSAAPARWIACSSRARPATSGASSSAGRSSSFPACRTRRSKRSTTRSC